VNFFAAFENHTVRGSVFQQNFRNWRFHPDFNTGFAGCATDGIGNTAGAASAETPRAERSVDFAHVVVQQNIGGAGRADAKKRADNSRGGHRRLQNVRLEPLIEKIGGAHGHKLHEVVFVLSGERLESLAEECELLQIARIE